MKLKKIKNQKFKKKDSGIWKKEYFDLLYKKMNKEKKIIIKIILKEIMTQNHLTMKF